MLSQLLTEFKNLFSRTFWFGNFLPVGIVAVLHLLLVEYAYPGVAPLADWWTASLGEQLNETSLAVIALIVLAYALGPFIPAARDFLDGQSMPKPLHDWLRNQRIKSRAREMRERPDETDLYAFLLDVAPNVEASGDIGLELEHPELTSKDEIPGLDTVEPAIAALLARHSAHQPIAFEDLLKVYGDLQWIVDDTNRLNNNPAAPQKVNAPPVQRQIRALTQVMRLLKADIAYRRKMFPAAPPRENIAATRVGEMRIFVENYSERLYGANFDYLWPRIQTVIAKEDPILARLQDAQAAINFSVLTFVLLQTIPLPWIVNLARLSDPVAVLVIGFGSVPLIWFAYEMVVQSQLVFGRLAWTAIDKHRLNVLIDIAHQPRPQTLMAERQLWQALQDNADRGDAHDLFLHKKEAP